MSRVKISIGLLLCIFVLCFISHFAIDVICERTLEQLDAVRSAAKAEDFERAKLRLDVLQESFATSQHWLELLMRRELVTSVSVNLHGLSAYANEDSASDLFTELDKASEQIRMLRHLFLSIF